MPFIALSVIGTALGIAGVLELGLGAVYGGLVLITLGIGIPYAQHLKGEDPRAH